MCRDETHVGVNDLSAPAYVTRSPLEQLQEVKKEALVSIIWDTFLTVCTPQCEVCAPTQSYYIGNFYIQGQVCYFWGATRKRKTSLWGVVFVCGLQGAPKPQGPCLNERL